MLKLTYKAVEYTFKQPFTISKGTKTKQPALLLSLGFKNIMRGYGETTEISYYPHSIADMVAILEKKKRAIEFYNMNKPERFWHFLHHLFPDHNFLISALDMAGWDLWAKMCQASTQEIMEAPSNDYNPLTSFTIGISSPENIRKQVKERPWPIYKLKLGGPNDASALKTLRQAAPKALLRIDVNEAWDLPTAKEMLPIIEASEVELIEQPFPKDDVDSLNIFRSLTKIPIIADEACQTEKDLFEVLGKYDGVNIKLSKCGGLTPALRMIKLIKSAKKKVMIGGMCEGNIGSTATAQLLPYADYADIDGPLLIKQSPGNGFSIENGKIHLPYGPGLGLRFV